MISHYTKPYAKPMTAPEKLVRVYRAEDVYRNVVLIPASEFVPCCAVGMPDYRLADELEG